MCQRPCSFSGMAREPEPWGLPARRRASAGLRALRASRFLAPSARLVTVIRDLRGMLSPEPRRTIRRGEVILLTDPGLLDVRLLLCAEGGLVSRLATGLLGEDRIAHGLGLLHELPLSVPHHPRRWLRGFGRLGNLGIPQGH